MMEYTIGSIVFDDWEIIQEIGEGSSGKVFEIQKNLCGEKIKSALKVIRIPKSVSDIRTVASEGMSEEAISNYFRGFVDEILHEVKVMISLKDHPNIVKYEDHTVIAHENTVGWDILIRMELLQTLEEWQMSHDIQESTVLNLGCEMCSVLAYAVDQGVMHRDIKPGNIFVDAMGNFKLGDFGISRTIEKTTGGLSKKGTESYMAPEVYLGKQYDELIDVYSLGIVLYKMLNHNRLPFYPPAPREISYRDRENALARRMSGEKIPRPCSGSEELVDAIMKACEYLPENRYSSMAEFYNVLKKLKVDDSVILVEKVQDNIEEAQEFIEETPENDDPTFVQVREKQKTGISKRIVAMILVLVILGITGIGAVQVYLDSEECIMDENQHAISGSEEKNIDENKNTIIGISSKIKYTTETKITFTASGYGMDNLSPKEGDVRYCPKEWFVLTTRMFGGPPYSATFRMGKPGTYEFTVTYSEQIFDGSDWKENGRIVSQKVDFTVVEVATSSTQ